MRVPLGRDGWYLCDGADPRDADSFEFHGDEELTFQWLNQFRRNTILWDDVRRFFDLSFRYDEAEILRQVASRLARRIWMARRPAWILIPLGDSGERAASAAFPLDQRRAPTQAKSSPAPDAAVFPEDADLAAIAQLQKEAAELGIPFCEECAKAAMASRW